MIAALKRANRWLNQRSWGLSAHSDTSLHAALKRLKRRGVQLETIIDVGASDGRWSRRVMTHYPTAAYLLLEANAVHFPALEAFTRRYPRSAYAPGVVGSAPGTIYFDASEPLGGAAYTNPAPGLVPLTMTTIDAEVIQRGLQPPYLLKTDTHGFEVPILDGAAHTLTQTSILILEAYTFQVAPGSLRFYELCADLERRGFRPVDLIDPLHRPHDQAWWQVDLVFARTDDPVFTYAGYA